MSLERKIIDYNQNKDDILHWVNLKGEYRYLEIIQFLGEQNIEPTWANVTRYIKYDKRILINAFKYIIFLEELYKSFIMKYKEFNQGDLLRFEFKRSLDEFLSLGDIVNYDLIDLNLLKNEKVTITQFRNSVVHNKILLRRKYNGKSLEEVINIFVKILPRSYRNGFINDINGCHKNLLDNLWHIEVKKLED